MLVTTLVLVSVSIVLAVKNHESRPIPARVRTNPKNKP